MSNTDSSLTSLLEEQATSSRRFVIEAVPDKSEVVKVTLLTPGMRLSCDAGVTMPTKAISSVKKTGDTVACCGKTLQAVELTFSQEQMVSYDDVFSTVRDVHTSVTKNIAQSVNGFSTSGGHSPIVDRAAEAGGSYGKCMVDALVNGPNDRKKFAIWMDTWANICGALYP